MKRIISIISLFIAIIFIMTFAYACNENSDITDPFNSNEATASALQKITYNSPSVNSFTPNYNEEEAMTMAGSMGKELYPIRIGQKFTLKNKDLALVKDSTTATGTLTQTFDGELIIAGSFQKPTMGIDQRVDTVIQKPFTTIITRQIKYEKKSNTGNDTLDWKIIALSLPSGGTSGEDISIQKLTLTTKDGSTVNITDPGSFFFNVGKDKQNVDEDDDNDYNSFKGISADLNKHGWNWLFTWYRANQRVKLNVEVLSASSDPDLLTVTYGAMMNGGNKNKYKFNLISSVQEGTVYRKTYESSFTLPSYHGRMHAVINALTRSSAYDTRSSVVEKTWGIPYKVQ